MLINLQTFDVVKGQTGSDDCGDGKEANKRLVREITSHCYVGDHDGTSVAADDEDDDYKAGYAVVETESITMTGVN